MKEEFDFESIKNKAIEQLKAGKPLLGKDGAFAPLLESILNAALEGEMDAYLTEERTRTINGLIIALEDLYKDKENCFRLQILRNYTQSFLLDIYDKTHCIFKQNHPGGINR